MAHANATEPSSKRIVFDARQIDSRFYGIERYALRLLEALAQTAPYHTFIVLRCDGAQSMYGWHRLQKLSNVTLQQAPPVDSPLREQMQLRGLLRRLRADLFHSPTTTTPLLSSVPAIMTVHDLIIERFPEYAPHWQARASRQMSMTLAIRRAQRVVAVSQAIATDLGHFYDLPAEKILVAREGVDAAPQLWQNEQRRFALRQRYGLPRPFILALGKPRPPHNFEALVEAFGLLAPHCDHDLIFVGADEDCFAPTAREAAARLGLTERVRFLCDVREDDLPGFYSLAQAVVAPSPSDGSGLPLLEAMAYGAPALINDAAALPEVAGDAALLVNATDKMAVAVKLRSLLRNTTLQTWLSKAGAQRAAAFTWSEAAAAITRAYDQLL